jgi:hypothetical protein
VKPQSLLCGLDGLDFASHVSKIEFAPLTMGDNQGNRKSKFGWVAFKLSWFDSGRFSASANFKSFLSPQ